MSGFARAANLVVSLVQLATAVAVPVITYVHLRRLEVEGGFIQCALDGENGVDSFRICNFAYAVGAVSLAAALFVAVFQLLTCCFCKVPQLINIIFQILGSMWWAIGASVLTRYAVPAFSATNPAFPADLWRALVLGISWLGFVSFVVGSCLGCAILDGP